MGIKKAMAGAALLAGLLCAFSGEVVSGAARGIDVVAWEDLSDRDISPEGRAALSLYKSAWKHAQTGHFVYHFTDERSAETVYVHAEIYYKWIKDFFGVSEDRWAKKNHIFIFSGEESWKEFLKRLKRPDYPEAFTTGWELFIERKPLWVSPRTSLAHELTHVIVFKFAEGPLPLFLNEGFANYVSRQLVGMQLDNAGYRLPYLEPIPEDAYIALKEISAMDSYPAGRTAVFYNESEWLVKFLISRYGKEKFYELLKKNAAGEDFGKSLEVVCGVSRDDAEADFREYSTGIK